MAVLEELEKSGAHILSFNSSVVWKPRQAGGHGPQKGIDAIQGDEVGEGR